MRTGRKNIKKFVKADLFLNPKVIKIDPIKDRIKIIIRNDLVVYAKKGKNIKAIKEKYINHLKNFK